MSLFKSYDKNTREWKGVGAGYISNDDGSNKVTPEDIANKTDKTYVDEELSKKESSVDSQAKATKALEDAKDYVNAKVKKDVPADANFEDTKYSNATRASSGLMSVADKGKLDGISDNANNYEHPENHLPSIISQDENNRFITDEQALNWDSKIDKTYVDNKVKTDVPLNAEFTDTISTKESIGLGDVDNTGDLDKPISTKTQTALDLKVDKAEIPDDAKFTDTITTVNGKTGVITKEDIVALGINPDGGGDGGGGSDIFRVTEDGRFEYFDGTDWIEIKAGAEVTDEQIRQAFGYTPANQADLDEHTMAQIHSGEIHGLRINEAKNLECFDGVEWFEISGGGAPVLGNIELSPITSLTTVIPEDGEAIITYLAEMTNIKNGTANYYVDGILRHSEIIEAGEISFDLTKYIKVGTTSIKIVVTDRTGYESVLTFIFNTISLKVSSIFNDSTIYSDDIEFRYTPVGDILKTVHFVLDGVEKYTRDIQSSGVQYTQLLNELYHGENKLEVYMTAVVGGKTIRSNTLSYNILYAEVGVNDVIISSDPVPKSISEGEILNIAYRVYNPLKLQTDVELSINGEVVNNLVVGREQQNWNLVKYPLGEAVEFKIRAGSVEMTYVINISPVNIDVEAVTEGLGLHLSPSGKTNAATDKNVWVSSVGDTVATLSGFNYINDGWVVAKESGENVLRLHGNSRLNIPYNLFEGDPTISGSTVEIEFTSRNVADISAPLISCIDRNIGIEIGSQRAVLSSEALSSVTGEAVETQYKENERLRISFVIESKKEERLVYTYINGIISGLKQYPVSDNFTQANPVGITIGSNFADIDIHSIRKYNNALTSDQLVDNYIADITNPTRKLQMFNKNDIFDSYSNIAYSKILKTIPCMTIIGDLSTFKGDKKVVSIMYENAKEPETNIPLMENVGLNVQGTSSQFYPRKNFDISLPEPYKLKPHSIAESFYCLKADYMESSHALNTGNVKIINDVLKKVYLYPTQVENQDIRSTIDGYIMALFHQEDLDSPRNCLGAYNFNNSEKNMNILDMKPGMEIWEMADNSAPRCSFKTWDDPDRALKDDFENRYPKTVDYTKLERLVSWVASTDGDIEKFKSEFEQYWHKDSVLTYYVLTEVMGLIDSMAKNLFVATFGDDGIWYTMWYDLDTCYGLNNEGVLTFPFSIEYHDKIGTKDVYNGSESVLWNNLEKAFPTEIKAMYQKMRGLGLDYDSMLSYLKGQQIEHIPEALYNYDTKYKYIEPLTKNNDGTYLYIAQGSRENHLKWWLENRLDYLDGKYQVGDYQSDFISMRLYTPDEGHYGGVKPSGSFNITCFQDQYLNIRFGALMRGQRVKKGEVATITPPAIKFNDTETVIYGASKISDIGFIADKYAGTVDISKATKLTRLEIGSDAVGYFNSNLEGVSIGNNNLLNHINIQNCVNLKQALDVTGCNNIKEIYAKGSSISTVLLQRGSHIKKLELPGTITNLTLVDIHDIEEFTIEDYSNITTLIIENTEAEGFNVRDIIAQATNLNWLRLLGVDWELEDLSILELISTMAGKDENNNNTDKSVVTGKCHIAEITQRELFKFNQRFPELEIAYDNLKFDFTVEFKNWDGAVLDTQQLLFGEEVQDPVTRKDVPISIPTRENTETHYYKHIGWDKDFSAIQTDATITVEYDYGEWCVVEFKDWNGAVLETQKLMKGENVIDPVTRRHNPIDKPSREEVGYIHTYLGWDSLPENIQTSVTINATYESKKQVTVQFVDWNGIVLDTQTILQGDSATNPITREIDPIEEPTRDDYTMEYAYLGWDVDFTNVQEDLIVTALYSTWMVVEFKDWDGRVLDTQRLLKGQDLIDPVTRELNPIAEPVRAKDSTHAYTYDGWDTELTNAQGGVITAKYISVAWFTVEFLNWDNTVLDTQEVLEGQDAINPIDRELEPIEIPSRDRDEVNSYIYDGWDAEFTNIVSDLTVMAEYIEVNWFAVNFVDWDGSILDTQEVVRGENAIDPITRVDNPIGEPERDDTETSLYTYDGWDMEFEDIQEATTITAIYNEIRVVQAGKELEMLGVLSDESGNTYGIEVLPEEFERRISSMKVMPPPPPIYGVEIDEANSNPETAVTYTDDAIGFTPASGNNGAFDWGSWEEVIKEEFKIRPCVLNNPAKTVNYYLNYDDYARTIDGEPSVLTGADGDVMVEFGRELWWKFSRTGNKLKIQLSVEHFDGAVNHAFDIEEGYNQFSFYPLTLTQIIMLLMLKNRDTQTALGRGYADGNSVYLNTGASNNRPFMYGETTGKQQVKFLGLEDYWGNRRQWIDGCFYDASRNMMIGKSNFNDTGAGYTNNGVAMSANGGGYIDTVQGGNNTGFIPKSFGGSATTHYTDDGYVYGGRLPIFGGYHSVSDNAGGFYLYSFTAVNSNANVGGRLVALLGKKLYIGVYLGATVSGKLRSVSGQVSENNKTIGTFRTLAKANNI